MERSWAKMSFSSALTVVSALLRGSHVTAPGLPLIGRGKGLTKEWNVE